MNTTNGWKVDRRSLIKTGLGGMMLASCPMLCGMCPQGASDERKDQITSIGHCQREEILFAGIRKPIQKREELEPRIEQLKKACAGCIEGPLTHIMRFDTPVDGIDSEIGFPVSRVISDGDIRSHTLRPMYFYTKHHQGKLETLRRTTGELYQYMNRTGLSPELELAEVYHDYEKPDPEKRDIEVMASFLAWPEVYREQLLRVLGKEQTAGIWRGGERLTPHTLVDPRCVWVGESIDKLKQVTNVDQQFDILSRVALIRPDEEINHYKKIYQQTRDVQTVTDAIAQKIKKSRPLPVRYDGKVLQLSKVPYKSDAYAMAKTPEEFRKANCFCNLVREARDPKIDPIFCYRAAGWDRQFWEAMLEVEFKTCHITHSILKGDRFCAWEYQL